MNYKRRKNQSIQEKTEFDYENWKSWTPEQWIKWSNSKEYKEKYLNVLNPYKAQEGYFPFKTYEDLDGPVLGTIHILCKQNSGPF